MNRRLEDERLADWVDGRLSAEELVRIEAEFAADPDLAAAAAEYRRTVEAVRGALRVAERPRAALADRVLARAAAETAAPADDRAGARFWPWIGSAAAAAALVTAFLWIRDVAERTVPESERTAYGEVDSNGRVADDRAANFDRIAGEAPRRFSGAEASEPTGGLEGVGRSDQQEGQTSSEELERQILRVKDVLSPDTESPAVDGFTVDDVARARRLDNSDAKRPKAEPAPDENLDRDQAPAPAGALAQDQFFMGAARVGAERSGAVALGTLVYVVEIPPPAGVSGLVAPVSGGRTETRAAPPAETASAEDDAAGAWSGYAFDFVQEPLRAYATWTANVMPPTVDRVDSGLLSLALTPAAGPVVSGEVPGKEQRARQDAGEAFTTSGAQPPAADAKPDPGLYRAFDGDAAFRVAGDVQQLDGYLTRLMARVAALGGQVSVQRAPFVPGPVREEQEAEARPVDVPTSPAGPAEPGVLLVLRQQAARVPTTGGGGDKK